MSGYIMLGVALVVLAVSIARFRPPGQPPTVRSRRWWDRW